MNVAIALQVEWPLVNGINFIIISVFPKLITFFHPDYFLSRRLVAIIWWTMIICTEIDQHVSITEQQYSTQFYCIYWMLYRDFGNWERPYCHVWDRQWAADTSFAPLAPWMNDKLCSLYFWNMNKVNFFFLARCLYTTQNKTWLLGKIEFLVNSKLHSFTVLTCEIPSWTLKEKFNSSTHPSIYYVPFNIQNLIYLHKCIW